MLRKSRAYSDLHNPEDWNVNSARGDKFYDDSDPADPGYKLPAHAESPLGSADSDSWESPASVKGDIAHRPRAESRVIERIDPF